MGHFRFDRRKRLIATIAISFAFFVAEISGQLRKPCDDEVVADPQQLAFIRIPLRWLPMLSTM